MSDLLVETYQQDLLALERDRSSREVSSMPWLPQLPETWAQEIYDRIEAQERGLIAPHLLSTEYEMGRAKLPDEIVEVSAENGSNFLFTAEHATQPVRAKTGKREDADTGTGGLAAVLAEDYGTALIMVGNQQSNAAVDADHPIKQKVASHLSQATGLIAVHAMNSGMFASKNDRTEIQAIIGLGAEPTEEAHAFAERAVKIGRDVLGLYVTIGNDTAHFVQKPHSTEIKLNPDGTPYTNKLAALRETTMVNFARNQMARLHLRQVPVLQIELTRFLRMAPLDTNERDQTSRVIGVALGYKLLQQTVELATTEAHSSN